MKKDIPPKGWRMDSTTTQRSAAERGVVQTAATKAEQRFAANSPKNYLMVL